MKEFYLDIKNLVNELCYFKNGRNHVVEGSLERAREVITNSFIESGCHISKDSWIVDGRERINITGSFGIENEQRIVIGAHYDSIFGTPGADDNASSVAVMLMVANLLKDKKINKRIDFVAFDCEEPPFFSRNVMGSMISANKYKLDNTPIDFMMCLEMLGFYMGTDSDLSDNFDDDHMYGIFDKAFDAGGRRDFLSILWRSCDDICSSVNDTLTLNICIPVIGRELNGKSTPLHFCDAVNFINIGVPTILLSDTGMIRNTNYHRATDTIETLNYGNLVSIAVGLSNSLTLLARE